jgi:predicted MFS family arabinose efflux permease
MKERTKFLAAFSVRSFRFQWPSDLLTSWALEMELLILNWYVLLETQSVVLLSLFAGLQYLGSLIAPGVGALADRVGRRRVLCGLRATYAALALLIMTLDFTGAIEPIFVFAIAAFAGLVRPSDLVMRNALIGDTMPTARLTNAMSLSRTTMDSARTLGPLVGAGLLVSLGLGVAYSVVALMYLVSLALTLGVEHIQAEDEPGPRPSPFRSVLDGLAAVRRSPATLALMWLAFLANLTGFPMVSNSGLLPYVAYDIYNLDATGLSVLAASYGVGALLASIGLAAMGGARRPVSLVFGGVAAWYMLLVAYGFTETQAQGMAILFLIGVAQGLAMISMAVALLRFTDARFRGRVMGVRMLAVYGLPVGLAIAGQLIDNFGFQATTWIFAGSGLALTTLIAFTWRSALFGQSEEIEP